MIAPLTKLTIRGAIWYQGETNVAYNNDLYTCTFSQMIDSWRQTWSSKTNDETPNKFPFGFVQLGTNEEQISESNPNSNWPLLCWHQTGDKGSVPNEILPNTFMATAMDTHDHESPYGAIHPRDKLNSLLHPDLNGLLFMKLIPSHIIIAKVRMPKLSREKPKSFRLSVTKQLC